MKIGYNIKKVYRYKIIMRFLVIVFISWMLFILSCSTAGNVDQVNKVKEICIGREELCDSLPKTSDPNVMESNIEFFEQQYPEFKKETGFFSKIFNKQPQAIIDSGTAWSSIFDSNSGVFYGKYCGRGNCKDQPESEKCKQYSDKIESIDDVDKECREHDLCYDKILKKYINKFPPKPDTTLDEKLCDTDLINKVEPFAKKLRIFSKTSEAEDKKYTAATVIFYYFKYIKQKALLREEDFINLKNINKK